MAKVTRKKSEAERLNRNAYLALAGRFSCDEGEEHIAALLRSNVVIDPIVRTALADALSANGERYSKARLRLSGVQDGEFMRKLSTREKRLKLGQRVLELRAEGQSRSKGESVVAEQYNCSLDSAKKATDYALQFADWEQMRPPNEDTAQGRIGWQLTFHTADILEITPEEYLAKMEETFAGYDADIRAGRIKVNL